MKPTEDRAAAPVAMFARFESRGSDDEVFGEILPGLATNADAVRTLELATCCRRALRVEKYSAEPKPVRNIDGRVPRHSCLRVFGPLIISRKAFERDAEPDCWTLVFSKSAG